MVEREELFEHRRYIGRRQKIGNRDIAGGGVDKLNAGIIACDVHVASGVSFETASKRRENGECVGKRVDEMRNESVRGLRGFGEENSLLDVMREKHV